MSKERIAGSSKEWRGSPKPHPGIIVGATPKIPIRSSLSCSAFVLASLEQKDDRASNQDHLLEVHHGRFDMSDCHEQPTLLNGCYQTWTINTGFRTLTCSSKASARASSANNRWRCGSSCCSNYESTQACSLL